MALFRIFESLCSGGNTGFLGRFLLFCSSIPKDGDQQHILFSVEMVTVLDYMFCPC